MNKFTKFLIILVCILLFIYLILNNYNKETENMSSKVGAKVGGGELSMQEYYSLSQYFDTYKNYIATKKYKSAYNMLGVSYRQYISYEEFEKNVIFKGVENLELEGINIITASTYDLVLTSDTQSGDKVHYSIVNDKLIDRVYIFPDSFLDYKKVGILKKSNKVKCELVDYIVSINKTELNFEMKNNKNEKLNISEATLYTNLDDVVTIKQDININAKETQNITLSFETDYAFPEKIVLRGNVGNKNVELVFQINN